MVALACLLGIAAIVWLQVKNAEARDYDAEAYRHTVEFTDWADWDWPIPDDLNEWQFPDREAS